MKNESTRVQPSLDVHQKILGLAWALIGIGLILATLVLVYVVLMSRPTSMFAIVGMFAAIMLGGVDLFIAFVGLAHARALLTQQVTPGTRRVTDLLSLGLFLYGLALVLNHWTGRLLTPPVLWNVDGRYLAVPALMVGAYGPLAARAASLKPVFLDRRLRRAAGVLLVSSAIVALGMTGSSVFQNRKAATIQQQREAELNLSRQLAAPALVHQHDRFDLALLLSLEAVRVAKTAEARDALRILVGAPRHSDMAGRVVSRLVGHRSGISPVRISHN